VIPTLLMLGLLTRRLWAIPVAAAGWGVLLLAMGLIGISQFPEAAFVGGANMAVGVLVHRGVAWPVRRVRSVRARPAS
jgi:hypothetical protein